MLTGPPTSCANLPSAGPLVALPHLLPSMSSFLLFLIIPRCFGWLGEASSPPEMLNPHPECRTMLLVKVTSEAVAHGATPASLRGVKRMQNPFCASAQLFSKTF